MDIPTILALIEKEAAALGINGPTATTFLNWLTGFIGALPAIEQGGADLKTWLETGFQIATAPDISNDQLDQIVANLKAQLAASDASVAADAAAQAGN